MNSRKKLEDIFDGLDRISEYNRLLPTIKGQPDDSCRVCGLSPQNLKEAIEAYHAYNKRTDADFAQVAQVNTTNQQILDRIELKLQEHLSQSYTNAIRGHKNEPKPRAKELMDFVTDMLKLEVEKEGK